MYTCTIGSFYQIDRQYHCIGKLICMCLKENIKSRAVDSFSKPEWLKGELAKLVKASLQWCSLVTERV